MLQKFLLVGAYGLSPSLLIVPYYGFFAGHEVDSLIAVIVSHVFLVFPFATALLVNAIDSYPVNLERVSILVGEGLFHRLARRILPGVRPQLLAIAALSFAGSFREFQYSLMLNYDSHALTFPVAIYRTNMGDSTNWELMLPMVMLGFLPGVLFGLSLLFSRTKISL